MKSFSLTCWRWLLAFCWLAAAILVNAAGLEFSDVFVSGQGGYHTYRIPAVVVSTNGTVLAFCEGRKKGGGDSGHIELLLKRSRDGGKTWSAQQVVWADGENTCGNPAPVVDRTTGVVWLLMTWNAGSDHEKEINLSTSRDSRRVYLTRSEDDGCSWAKPREITAQVKRPEWQWYATGPVNGIQLTRGPHKARLVIPCNHTVTNSQNKSVSRSHVIYSDDHGTHWNIGGIEQDQTNESTVVERSDGSLLHNMRSYRGRNRRLVATSPDAGLSWSPVKADAALIEPVCQGSILRCTWPENGQRSRILFSNPASTKREKLTVRLSYDEGATWPISKVLQEGPAAYSCLTVLPDGTAACLFELGQGHPYEKITLVRFPLGWLEDEKN